MAPRYPEPPWRVGYLDGLNEAPYQNTYTQKRERIDYDDGYKVGTAEREALYS